MLTPNESEVYSDYFKNLPQEYKDNLYKIVEPMLLAFSILVFSSRDLGIDYLSSQEISHALEDVGISLTPISISRAFSRAGKKISQRKIDGVLKYRIMGIGIEEIEQYIALDGPKVVYMKNGEPFTNRKKVKEILNSLRGNLSIIDPYYGARSFSMMSEFQSANQIRFLSAQSNEKKNDLISLYSDYSNEVSNLEIRIYPNIRELHDRYIVSDDQVILLGHGLKDIGKKESFLIVLEKNDFPDLYDSLLDVFNTRWANSTPLK